jgi:hypothetical protein
MRLNSTVKCEIVTGDRYPAECGGDMPVQQIFTHFGEAVVKLCIPGASGTVAWNPSRSSQTIREEMFIWSGPPGPTSFMEPPRLPGADFTARCVAETTRGYFELPNHHNGGRPGPLLGKWPGAAELRDEGFGDRLPDGAIPSDR